MEIVTLLGLLAIIVLFLAAESYQMQYMWPVARTKIEATWPMRPTEGFANMTLEQWLPSPEVLTKPAVGECPGTLMNAAGYDGQLKIKNYDLLSDVLKPKVESRIASGPTAEICYGIDYTNAYQLSSYAQRTNNYKHVRPDSCSAPNQDLILGFYK